MLKFVFCYFIFPWMQSAWWCMCGWSRGCDITFGCMTNFIRMFKERSKSWKFCNHILLSIRIWYCRSNSCWLVDWGDFLCRLFCVAIDERSRSHVHWSVKIGQKINSKNQCFYLGYCEDPRKDRRKPKLSVSAISQLVSILDPFADCSVNEDSWRFAWLVFNGTSMLVS